MTYALIPEWYRPPRFRVYTRPHSQPGPYKRRLVWRPREWRGKWGLSFNRRPKA